jgi:hypothetical protein
LGSSSKSYGEVDFDSPYSNSEMGIIYTSRNRTSYYLWRIRWLEDSITGIYRSSAVSFTP